MIAHPSNPVEALTASQIQDIYAGKITNWSQLGGEDAPITVVDREAGSGLRSAFKERIFGPNYQGDIGEVDTAIGTDEMSQIVSSNPFAIGYVGTGSIKGTKPLTLVNECGQRMEPNAFNNRTNEYPWLRVLYLYNREGDLSPQTQEFLSYVVSPAADQLIAKAGFVDLGILKHPLTLESERGQQLISSSADAYEGNVMREMLGEMTGFDRLSTTFRFNTGSSRLNPRGFLNLRRLSSYLADIPQDSEVLLVGFTDDVGAFEANRNLSVSRAEQVREQLLASAGGQIDSLNIRVAGFGEVAPVACNTSEEGRGNNRRVEVWLKQG